MLIPILHLKGRPTSRVQNLKCRAVAFRRPRVRYEPSRTKGARKIAEEFGVSPSTVQAISRPLDTSAAAA